MYIAAAGPPEAEMFSLQAAIDFLRLGRNVGDNPKDDAVIADLIIAAREYAEVYTGRSLAKKPYVQVHDSFPYYVDAVQSRDAYPPSYYSAPRYSTTQWNYSQQIKLLYPPLISVEKITYIGTDQQEHDLISGQDFQVDPASQPGRIFPLAGGTWPACFYCVNAVRIFFTAGYETQSTETSADQIDNPSVTEPETEQVQTIPADGQVASYLIDRTLPRSLALAVKQLVVHWYNTRDPIIAQAGGGGKFVTLPNHVEALLDSGRSIDFAPTRG
jgi:hypothetical protein